MPPLTLSRWCSPQDITMSSSLAHLTVAELKTLIVEASSDRHWSECSDNTRALAEPLTKFLKNDY